MSTHRGGQQIGYGDPADVVVRRIASIGDGPDTQLPARVVVIVGEDDSITRYASWLADTHETQILRGGERVFSRPEADVVVIDQQTLTMAKETADRMVRPGRRDCQVLASATVESCDGLVDEYIPELIGRGGLLWMVEAAMRIATYDATVAKLLSLTMRRRKLRNRSNAESTDRDQDISSLSKRIDELHRRIDDGLSDVESQYAALLEQRHRLSTRQKTENEKA